MDHINLKFFSFYKKKSACLQKYVEWQVCRQLPTATCIHCRLSTSTQGALAVPDDAVNIRVYGSWATQQARQEPEHNQLQIGSQVDQEDFEEHCFEGKPDAEL